MVRDTLRYLPDDILAKVDRAGMSVSLETRMPLLDHRLLELAWRLPAEHKLADGVGKRVLRTVLHRYVPRRWSSGRSKVSRFRWINGCEVHCATGARDYSIRRAFGREGFLDPEPIGAAWCDHQAGRRNGSHQLWTVLMFQAWLERYGYTM